MDPFFTKKWVESRFEKTVALSPNPSRHLVPAEENTFRFFIPLGELNKEIEHQLKIKPNLSLNRVQNN